MKDQQSILEKEASIHAFDLSIKRRKSSTKYDDPKRKEYGFLRAGSLFTGYQTPGESISNIKYPVAITLDRVDLTEGFLSGSLKIENLVPNIPTLTTYFEGEIIGPQYSFHTNKWHADYAVDLIHWNKFPPFYEFLDKFVEHDKSSYGELFIENPLQGDYVFMRLKEKFVLPYKANPFLNGASYDGFYYACMHLETGSLSAFYYYPCSKKFQNLKVQPVREKFKAQSYDFQ
ncbi:Vacuolar import/degradation protein Vid24 domain-containing protein [Rozella allomycis CSF55]|uniref:Vacuolar import/degradation protein Vid24 domain-containing protein n=1 Tax=Rozella allomycis (strain CSF55) TaxID=988480 RepID=A0A075ANA7_ROZAC|nr:Vacuolar import/degradation protein Vid24 domain-containing protein [Rozella allomycis CSF55]|eukprot:EPZ31287.1 Vacuolar import/degradation protein Vid24 domain-containing protein [Rozella allomycis CSF55]